METPPGTERNDVKVVIQCRNRGRLTRKEIMEFSTQARDYAPHAEHCFVTTAPATLDINADAKDNGVTLIDRATLERLLNEYSPGSYMVTWRKS